MLICGHDEGASTSWTGRMGARRMIEELVRTYT